MSMSDYHQFAATFPWFLPAVVTVLGAMVGSFLNVCIYRIPAEQSIVTPGSHCACGKPIAWYDNIPVFSWFVLRGKARCCGRPYSFRYAFVELLTAALFLACWQLFPADKAVCGLVFVSVLIAATFIDLDHMIIPDVFTLGAGVFGVLLSFLVPALHGQHGGFFLVDSLRSGTAGLQGLLVGSGLVLWIALLAEMILKKEAMGFGDVKFVGMIGAFCGWQGAVFSIFGGAVVGTLWFVIALLVQKLSGKPAAIAPPSETPEGEAAPLGFGMHVPFGPMLAIAGLLYFLIFHRWVADYFATLRELL
jgi:leader peptidase (prepilin peptidase)/N-methyltransferase